MRKPVRLLGGTVALLAVLGVGPAFAAQQTTLTKITGVTSGSGTWTRTITDVTEPGGPGRASVQAIYNVNVNWTNNMSSADLALAYQIACNAALPSSGPNAYHAWYVAGIASPGNALPSPGDVIQLTKLTGTYNFTDSPFPTGASVTTTTSGPVSGVNGPITSPVTVTVLVIALAALAYRARRRRVLS